jgi:mono/diheme cytochrome c family protein
MTMMKAFVLTVALAACGSKSKPAETMKEPPPPTEAAKETPPNETKPAEPTGPSEAELAVAQAELAAQYEDGKKVYVAKKCDTCHGKNGEGNPKNPSLIGEKALPEQPAATAKLRKGVTFKTAKDVMDFVKAKMPPKSPNTLTDDEAAAVTSWILSESKVNITKKLDASNAASVNLR